ncbi:MAG: PDR/VanB family oxidoreductase [Comamonas sp.]|uniref:PDR/VanB family oxidoreductase n=1 Tax=Comamonas sp. TaxID=34028 RepID=UPI002FCBA391
MSALQVIVHSRRVEAEGICSFELVHPEGQALPAFSAGAHVDVHVAPGLVRQYSLCNDPATRDHYRIAVLREPQSRGGSVGMHEQVHEGQLLTISAPRNHFELAPGAARSLLLAGGIGITPIWAMAQALHSRGEDFALHYCGRSAARMAFVPALSEAAFAGRVQLHADDGEPAQRFDADALLAAPEAGAHLYVCGPAGFMHHVLETARRHGWPEAQLHREFFAGTATALESDGAFSVRLASTGQSYAIAKDKSVLEVLTAAGVDVPYSCESGICGSCLTRVLEGVPEHRDSFLTDSERAANDQFTPCCSRAQTPLLVLDL